MNNLQHDPQGPLNWVEGAESSGRSGADDAAADAALLS